MNMAWNFKQIWILGGYSFKIKRYLEMEGWLWIINKKEVMAPEEEIMSHSLISTSKCYGFLLHTYVNKAKGPQNEALKESNSHNSKLSWRGSRSLIFYS